MLQLSLDLYYTEDEIYELSYTKEPKNPKIQVSKALLLSEADLAPSDSRSNVLFARRRAFAHSRWVEDFLQNKSTYLKLATSKRRALGKCVMWWVCTFFLFVTFAVLRVSSLHLLLRSP